MHLQIDVEDVGDYVLCEGASCTPDHVLCCMCEKCTVHDGKLGTVALTTPALQRG